MRNSHILLTLNQKTENELIKATMTNPVLMWVTFVPDEAYNRIVLGFKAQDEIETPFEIVMEFPNYKPRGYTYYTIRSNELSKEYEFDTMIIAFLNSLDHDLRKGIQRIYTEYLEMPTGADFADFLYVWNAEGDDADDMGISEREFQAMQTELREWQDSFIKDRRAKITPDDRYTKLVIE